MPRTNFIRAMIALLIVAYAFALIVSTAHLSQLYRTYDGTLPAYVSMGLAIALEIVAFLLSIISTSLGKQAGPWATTGASLALALVWGGNGYAMYKAAPLEPLVVTLAASCFVPISTFVVGKVLGRLFLLLEELMEGDGSHRTQHGAQVSRSTPPHSEAPVTSLRPQPEPAATLLTAAPAPVSPAPVSPAPVSPAPTPEQTHQRVPAAPQTTPPLPATDEHNQQTRAQQGPTPQETTPRQATVPGPADARHNQHPTPQHPPKPAPVQPAPVQPAPVQPAPVQAASQPAAEAPSTPVETQAQNTPAEQRRTVRNLRQQILDTLGESAGSNAEIAQRMGRETEEIQGLTAKLYLRGDLVIDDKGRYDRAPSRPRANNLTIRAG